MARELTFIGLVLTVGFAVLGLDFLLRSTTVIDLPYPIPVAAAFGAGWFGVLHAFRWHNRRRQPKPAQTSVADEPERRV